MKDAVEVLELFRSRWGSEIVDVALQAFAEVEARPKLTVVRRPARRWTFVCRANCHLLAECRTCREEESVRAGESFRACCRSFPSGDAAETWAREFYLGDPRVTVLGAEPLPD